MFDRKNHKKEFDKKRDSDNRKLIQRWKLSKGCAYCGYKKHYAALQLDHIDPSTKHKTRVRTAINYKWGKDRIKNELGKCQVLCANCHSIRTLEEKHHHINH